MSLSRQCIYTNATNCGATYIIPPNNSMSLLNNKYNNIYFRSDISNKFTNFDFTIFPDPISVEFDNNINDYIGTFNIILENGTYKECKLLAASKYLLRWHFYKFIEKNKYSFNFFGLKFDMTSNDYTSSYICNIVSIGYCNLRDKDNDVIMYPEMIYN